MADSKWIDDIPADTPLTTAARRVLSLRLEAVNGWLPAAVHHADDDLENVHQLRVSTRRAGAAVRIFEECLPPRRHKSIKKVLKRIRRAAGAARDWDVFQEMLAHRRQRMARPHAPGLDFLLGYGQARRTLAQADLHDLESLADGEFAIAVGEVLAAIEDDAMQPAFRSQAVPLLTVLLREIDTAARLDLKNYEHLHQIRILGKQLRYAMEVFASCFEPEFRERIYPAVEEMQEILGDANDSHVAAGSLQGIKDRCEKMHPREWPPYQAGVEGLIRYHQRRLPQQRRLFEKWWKNWQASGMEKQFESMLRD